MSARSSITTNKEAETYLVEELQTRNAYAKQVADILIRKDQLFPEIENHHYKPSPLYGRVAWIKLKLEKGMAFVMMADELDLPSSSLRHHLVKEFGQQWYTDVVIYWRLNRDKKLQTEILLLECMELNNTEIADELNLKPFTVECFMFIYRELGL